MLYRFRSQGFTIAELIVVIVIIALLAAVVTIAYTGVSHQANEVGLVNDLKKTGEQLQLDALDGIALPTSLPASTPRSNDSIMTLTTHAGYTAQDAFCINGYSISSKDIYSYRPKYGVRAGICPTQNKGTALGGTYPEPFFDVNINPGLRDWEVASGTGVKINGSRTEARLITTVNGTIRSPKFKVTGSTSITLRMQVYATENSSYFATQSRSGVHTGAAYYGADTVTNVLNSSGYGSNGNAQSTPLNQWSTYTVSYATGPNVHFAYLTINSSVYTSNNILKDIEVIINK